jgi:hypothetical protein
LSNKNFLVRNGINVGSWNLVNEQGNLNANTLTLLSPNFPVINVGTLTANTLGSANATSYSYSDGTAPGYTYQLDDISSIFDGISTTFTLSSNGTALSPNNPMQLNIMIGGVPVFPLKSSQTDYFNLTSFDVNFSTGSRAMFTGFTISGNTITFSSPPYPGMNFFGTMRTNNDKLPTFVTSYSPFTPLNMMFSY